MLGAMVLLALQGAVPAQGSVELDLRCLVLSAQLRMAADERLREAGEAASNFFFGRVDARVPDQELEERMWTEWLQVTDENRRATVEACGTYMQARGTRMIEIGGQLQARESEQGRRR